VHILPLLSLSHFDSIYLTSPSTAPRNQTITATRMAPPQAQEPTPARLLPLPTAPADRAPTAPLPMVVLHPARPQASTVVAQRPASTIPRGKLQGSTTPLLRGSTGSPTAPRTPRTALPHQEDFSSILPQEASKAVTAHLHSKATTSTRKDRASNTHRPAANTARPKARGSTAHPANTILPANNPPTAAAPTSTRPHQTSPTARPRTASTVKVRARGKEVTADRRQASKAGTAKGMGIRDTSSNPGGILPVGIPAMGSSSMVKEDRRRVGLGAMGRRRSRRSQVCFC
jgi:hypothetical protein